jgi:hypothetical protein
MDKTAVALELRDIHIGDASMWPMAIGWWLVLLVLCITLYFLWKKIKQYKRRKHLNALMQKELISIREKFKKNNNKHQLAGEVSQLLKRFVRYVLQDLTASSLTGNKWLDYLDSKVDYPVFSELDFEVNQAQYMKNSDFDVPKLLAAVKNYFPKAIKSLDGKINTNKNINQNEKVMRKAKGEQDV